MSGTVGCSAATYVDEEVLRDTHISYVILRTWNTLDYLIDWNLELLISINEEPGVDGNYFN